MEVTPELANHILKFEIFKGLDQETKALTDLLQVMEKKNFPPREVILGQDAESSEMFFLCAEGAGFPEFQPGASQGCFDPHY